MKKVLVVLCLCVMLCGCNDESNNLDVYKIMEENEHVILDVRTSDEYTQSHVVGAINIPYDEIDENVNLDKESIIFVYCMSGTRSEIALNTLTRLGYTVYDLGAFNEVNLPKE